MRKVPALFVVFRWEHGCTERVSNLLKVTQLVNGQLGLAAQKAWLYAHGLDSCAPLPMQGDTVPMVRVLTMPVM